MLMPKVKPPIPKNKTIKIARKKPEETPIDRAIPPITPPNHLSFAFLFTTINFEVNHPLSFFPNPDVKSLFRKLPTLPNSSSHRS